MAWRDPFEPVEVGGNLLTAHLLYAVVFIAILMRFETVAKGG